MRMTVRLAALLSALFIYGSVAAQSHQAVRDQLFAQADAAKKAADEHNARVLAPTAYAAALELYVDATERLEKGKDIEDVRGDLAEATGDFERATDAAKLAEVTFATTLAARDAAERAEAARYAEKDWERAEAAFMAAAEQLEGGNLRKATSDSLEVERRYREVEAKAISARTRAGL